MMKSPPGIPASIEIARRLPVGAEVGEQGVHFRVWAPTRRSVEVEILNHDDTGLSETLLLARERNGYFSGLCRAGRGGILYRFRLDGEESYPDPASRYQPQGPHGPSQVVDPRLFPWTDHGWNGPELHGQVAYEMHVGTYTQEGTFEAALRELPRLSEMGVTLLEIMPVAEFPGRFGWGYDGVDLFAPTRLYGTPDSFRAFVDRAHGLGLAVILDVVYNHLGPDGDYLRKYSPHYFTDRYTNEWGQAINFDGEHSAPVREFFTANAGYWIDEFHLDGLRLDATQTIFDASGEHIISAVTSQVRSAAKGRATLVIAENEAQEIRMVRPIKEGGYGADALWNDDFHHSAAVAMTGHNEAYYTDYLGGPQEFISLAKRGYLYQGQRYHWQKKRRGTPSLSESPATFVLYLQNHDQVANSCKGERIHRLTSPGLYRAMTALLLLSPGTPMLFQGQEFASSAPFLYFADHSGELRDLVKNGRREFLSQFPSMLTPAIQDIIPIPSDEATFLRSKLDHSERDRHTEAVLLHRDLLRLRREDPVFRAQRTGGIDGAVLGSSAFVLRYFGGESGDRLLIVNLGMDLHLVPAPEPLLAPESNSEWRVLWSSEDPHYGGNGAPPPDAEDGWHIPGRSASVLCGGCRQ